MTKVYQVLYGEYDQFGVAHTIQKNVSHFLPYYGEVQDWAPLEFELRDGDFPDYLASNLGFRICSGRLREILESRASPEDKLQWLDVFVEGRGKRLPYFVLHFPDPPDVLNRSETLFVENTDVVVRPVLSKDAVGSHQVFAYPKSGELKLFISEIVMRAIEAAGCTGLEMERAPVR